MTPQVFFPKLPKSRFHVGQRVRLVGSQPPRFGTIDEVIQRGRHTAYRLTGSTMIRFESDLAEVQS